MDNKNRVGRPEVPFIEKKTLVGIKNKNINYVLNSGFKDFDAFIENYQELVSNKDRLIEAGEKKVIESDDYKHLQKKYEEALAKLDEYEKANFELAEKYNKLYLATQPKLD